MNAIPGTNETIRLLTERGSVRSYEERPIPPDVLRQVLEAGAHSATGGNLQPYSIIKIENPETKARLADLCGGQQFIADAPVDLVFCIDLHRLERWAALETAPFTANRGFRNFWVSFQDTIICAQSICTAADAVGLSSCYVASILECFPELIEMCALPKGVFPVVLLSLGYPKVAPKVARKLGPEVVVHDETYHDPADDELLAAFNEKYPAYQLPITEERVEEMRRVCREVHGPEFAEKCVGRIRANGYINMIQRYYGLHYQADEMPAVNDDFVSLLEKSGLTPFKKFEPPVEGPSNKRG